MESDEITQMLHQLGVSFNKLKSTNEFVLFEVPEFGLRVIWSLVKYEEENDEWNVVIVYPQHEQREVREKIIWALGRGGFFHYLRVNYPNTFNKMLAGREGEDWHRKIIKKRLEEFGNKPKYNYYRDLNEQGLRESSMIILSMDPGFYDFIP
jgi:hypothetical protein